MEVTPRDIVIETVSSWNQTVKNLGLESKCISYTETLLEDGRPNLTNYRVELKFGTYLLLKDEVQIARESIEYLEDIKLQVWVRVLSQLLVKGIDALMTDKQQEDKQNKIESNAEAI